MTKQVGLFFVLMFVIGTDTFLISPMLPTLQTVFQIRIEDSGWMVGAYALGYAVFALIAGPLSDQWNRKKVMVIGMTAFSLTTFLCGLAVGFWSMFVFRFLAGISAAFVAPQVWALIPILVSPPKIIRTFGIVTAGLSVAQLLGVPIGSYLASFHWSVPFMTVGLVSLIITLFIHLWIPTLPSTSTNQSLSIVTRYKSVFSKPKSRVSFLAYFFFQLANFSSFSFIGTYLSSTFDLTITQIGAAMMLFGTGNLAGSLLSGKITSKWGVTIPFYFGMLVLIVAYFLLCTVQSLMGVKILFFLIFFTGGFLFPILMSALQSLSPESRGTTASVANSLMYGAATLGSYLAGILFAKSHGFSPVSLFSAIGFILSLILFGIYGVFSANLRVRKNKTVRQTGA